MGRKLSAAQTELAEASAQARRPPTPHTPETRSLAASLVAAGLSVRDAAAAVELATGAQVSFGAVALWAAAAIVQAGEDDAWITRKKRELACTFLIQAETLVSRATDGTGKDTREDAVAAGIFIDKAILLTGGDPTSRFGSSHARVIEGRATSSDAKERLLARLSTPTPHTGDSDSDTHAPEVQGDAPEVTIHDR